MNFNIKELIKDKKILVFIGSGGVGKTTISASVALKAAIEGKKVIVLTIDPAKRLANSLGVEVSDKVTEINLTPLKELGVNPKGKLFAMMLDMKSTMDNLVKEEVSEEKQKALFKNKAYKSFSTSLPGTHEFAAMEMVWKINNSKEYDLIVLDTPPTSNALDFFTFPQRIFDTFDNRIAKLLISIYEKSGKFSFGFFNFSTQIILRGINKLTGSETLEILSSFLFQISELMKGVKSRSQDIFQLFRDDSVAFVVVTSPSLTTLKEGIFFQKEINKFNFNFKGFIINRMHTTFASEDEVKNIEIEKLVDELIKEKEFENMAKYKLKKVVSKLYTNLKQINKLSDIERGNLSPLDAPYIKIPLFKTDIYSFSGLLKIIEVLSNNDNG